MSSSTRRLERRIECGRDCGWTSAVDGIGTSTAKGVDDIVEVVEEWSQSGFVFNVFPIVYEDDPKDFIAGSFLVADKRLYKRLCPSVGPSVRLARVVTLEFKTRILAPAHPSATGFGRVIVYPALL